MRSVLRVFALLLAGALISPAFASAAGIPGATVKIVNPADGTEFATALTDAAGAFAFENLPAGAWRLDVATADLAGLSQQLFAVPPEKDPARCGGLVTSLEGADVSLQVNAAVASMSVPGLVLSPGYPRLQRAWNLNWLHANGRLFVRLAGPGLDGLTGVTLTSATGSIQASAIVFDPLLGEYRALFAKRAAFAALVPVDAQRGDTVAIAVGVVTATATQGVETSVRIVGPKRRHTR